MIVGIEADAQWYGKFSPNATDPLPAKNSKVTRETCLPACLYDLATDPGEHHNIAGTNIAQRDAMLKRFAELEGSYHPAVLPPPALKASFCDAATAHSGFTAPFCPYANSSAYCQ